jgi:hypothetical protein
MEDMQMLLEPIRASLRQVGEFLPRVLLATLILIAGWLVAKAARFATVRMLRAINFNVVTEKAGIDGFLKQGGGDTDTVHVLGVLVYWLALLAALMIASNSLGLADVTALIGRIVLFVPKVMIAVVILAFGAYFAKFVGSAVITYCKNVDMHDADVLGKFAQYAIMAFVVLIAVEQLGLSEIIRETFLILVAAVGLALALAFGIGGAKRAGELIERWSRRTSDETGKSDKGRPSAR